VAGERARLFVALELPGEVRDALVAWRAPVLASSGRELRPVAEDALHVTLCFLGQRPAIEVPAISAACAAADRDPVTDLVLAASLWLPRRRPHALTVAIADRSGRLAKLQTALAATLAAGGWFEDEERAFLPHVTVARVRRSADPRALARQELPAPPALAFAGAAVTLYRSHLGQGGARYEALARVPLHDAAA
jgi:2'-5' RNA ligase